MLNSQNLHENKQFEFYLSDNVQKRKNYHIAILYIVSSIILIGKILDREFIIQEILKIIDKLILSKMINNFLYESNIENLDSDHSFNLIKSMIKYNTWIDNTYTSNLRIFFIQDMLNNDLVKKSIGENYFENVF